MGKFVFSAMVVVYGILLPKVVHALSEQLKPSRAVNFCNNALVVRSGIKILGHVNARMVHIGLAVIVY
jgi:hypothetical protein